MQQGKCDCLSVEDEDVNMWEDKMVEALGVISLSRLCCDFQFLSHCPRDIESMAPQITYNGEYVLLVEYNNMEEAIKICSASTGQLISIIPVSTISLKLTHLALPSRGECIVLSCFREIFEQHLIKTNKVKSTARLKFIS